MSECYELTLEWDVGRVETVRAKADQTVVVAALDAGVQLPVGCLTGACATCTGQLLAGELHHRRPPRSLKTRHIDAGYVLLCVAEPRSDCRIRVGSKVQSELVENPWK